MYFKDRAHAGLLLAEQLQQYRYDNCVVMALNNGGVLVGEQIAVSLHSILTVLLTEEIGVPGEQVAFGSIDHAGGYVPNQSLSGVEYDAYLSEFHGYLEDQKREKFQHMNRLLGDGGILDHDLLREHVIILVSDGLGSASPLDSAAAFLKAISIKRLITVTPVASVQAVDRMHIMSDELHVLSVTDNFLGADHYYDDNRVPSIENIIEVINKAILNWR